MESKAMKFPTAKEIRESVKQNNKKTIKLARKNFNKYKKISLRNYCDFKSRTF